LLLIYDCDGTLIDTESACAEVCLAAIRELGLPGWDLDRYVDTFVGSPSDVGWAVIEGLYGKPLPDGFNDRIDREIERRLTAEIRVMEGVVEAVTALDLARCVASSTSRVPLLRNLATAGLLEHFGEAVFSASQVARGKPHPDVFLFAAAKMGFDPADSLVIEDSVPGVLAARAAGMAVVGYVGAAHDRARMRARLSDAGAVEVIETFAEWPAAVARRR